LVHQPCGNTCVDAVGQPFFIDWAGPAISHWAIDVAYFITGSLSVADRRATEHDLFHHYLKLLAGHSGPALDIAAAWDDYRRHLMHGMNWTSLPSTLQPVNNVHAMGERFATALIEHGTLKLLGA
jgi:hypothetical protein